MVLDVLTLWRTDSLESSLEGTRLPSSSSLFLISLFLYTAFRCYETPAGTILRAAHVDLEGLTLDREVRRLKDQYTQKLAEIIYNGFWFSAEREFLMSSVSFSQKLVNGIVKVKLYKGNVVIEGRSSPNSLYDEKIASMDETDGFHPVDSEGFIKIQSIRLKAYQIQKSTLKK